MRSLLNKLLGWITGRRPKLRCNRAAWRIGTAELARRTRGRTQESGAYLLGATLSDGSHLIREFVFYDDIAPHALAPGEVTIRQTDLQRLWAHCRARSADPSVGQWCVGTCRSRWSTRFNKKITNS